MISWSKTPCTRTLEAHFSKAARRNFRPVKNLGAQLFRSHQESIISSRELHDRTNTNTSSRSEILTPNSSQIQSRQGRKLDRCAVNTITFKLIERQRRGWMTPSQPSWVFLKQPSTHSQVLNLPRNVKIQPASSVSCERSNNVERFRVNEVSTSQKLGRAVVPHFPFLFKPQYPNTNSPN